MTLILRTINTFGVHLLLALLLFRRGLSRKSWINLLIPWHEFSNSFPSLHLSLFNVYVIPSHLLLPLPVFTAACFKCYTRKVSKSTHSHPTIFESLSYLFLFYVILQQKWSHAYLFSRLDPKFITKNRGPCIATCWEQKQSPQLGPISPNQVVMLVVFPRRERKLLCGGVWLVREGCVKGTPFVGLTTIWRTFCKRNTNPCYGVALAG